MWGIKISIIFCIASFAYSQQVANDDEKPFLRILAPKFICNDKHSNVTSQSNNITIRLQTREGQRLKYSIKVDFENQAGFKSQQHTLSIWKNIRLLEKKFSSISDEISQKNQIDISAQELTPQVIYTFKIIGTDDSNRQSEPQSFTITYKGGELKAQRENLGDGVSFLLLSAEFLYDDMEFLVVGDVFFCDPINDYSYKWSMEGIKSEALDISSISGNALKLLPRFFTSGNSVVVTAKLLNNESLIMAQSSMSVKILAKDFQLQNVPSECMVGINREIPFQALLSRQPNADLDSFKWTCSPTDCGEFKNSSYFFNSVSFSAEGNFELTSEISINNVAKKSTSLIITSSKIIPHVQLKYFPLQPINAMEQNDVIMTILNLVPKCTAYWNIINGEGFAGFKEGAEGDFIDMGRIVVKNFEEYFLQELVDYDNNTLSQDVTLSIPPNSLVSNEKSKFRLTIICPEPLTESITQPDQKNITSYFDVILMTNAPPDAMPLIIKPDKGVSMKQKFKFQTGDASDSPSDFPLKYTFGYIVNNLTVIIGSFYENTVVHTQLPYSDSIETFLEVCDNNGACSRVSGTTVETNTPVAFSSDEIEFKIKEFEATLSRAEYQSSLNSAVVFLLTQRQVSQDVSEYENRMLAMMENEMKRIEATETTMRIYQLQIVEFVNMSMNIMSIMSTSDETFVTDLLALTDTLNQVTRVTRMTSTKLNAPVVTSSPEHMRNVLSLLEMLLTSSNPAVVAREKKKFLENVHNFVAQTCQNKNLNVQKIQSRFVAFEVSKIFSPLLAIDPQKMSNHGDPTTFTFAQNGNFAQKYLCVGKIRLMMDMFVTEDDGTSPMVYEMLILDEDEGGAFKPITVSDLSDNVRVETPIGDPSYVCLLWSDNNWESDPCSTVKSNATIFTCKCKTASVTGGIVIKTGKAKIRIEVTSKTPPNVLSDLADTTTAFTFLSTRKTLKNEATSALSEDVSSVSSTTQIKPTSAVEVTTLRPTVAIQPPTEATTKKLPGTTLTPPSSLTQNPANEPPSPLTQNPATKSPPVQTQKPATQPSAPLTQNPATEPPSLVTLKTATQPPPAQTTLVTELPSIKVSTLEIIQTTNKPMVNTITPRNTSSENIVESSNASASWTLIILLLVFFALIVILFLAHRCRQYANSHSNLPMRNPASTIKYAKYHDEFTMRG